MEVSLQKEEIILTSLRAQQGEVAEELDPMKLVADAKSSKNLDKCLDCLANHGNGNRLCKTTFRLHDCWIECNPP